MGRHRALKGQRRLPGAEDITVTNTSVRVKKPAKAGDDIGHAKTEADPKLKSTLSASGDADDAPPSTIPPSAPIVLPPALAERFEVGKLLGHGGMGDVYQAHDKRLGRDIALKILRAGRSTVNETLFREARAQASLEHPNACKVYEMGVEGDIRYIVMQLINGVSLDKVGDELTLEQKVKIVQQISKGLHEVHRMGLVHRDLKPSNIMVENGERGEHKAYLMDFGLAREIGAQGHTVTGVVAGTPAFMAPEQGRGEIRKLDRRTDVYSLGATMYSLFTGKPPFEASSLYTLLEKISTEDPQPLRKVDPTIPIDIEAVVLKCLEKEPHHRYESAKALDEDLQRFLDGEPVRARDASIVYVLYKKIRKHKLFVSIAAAAFAVVLVFAAMTIRSQRISVRREELSRRLGESVKEIEYRMRLVYARPLHDVENERDEIAKKLVEIENEIDKDGDVGKGVRYYAIGRGYLVLQQPEKALEYLQRAKEAGYSDLKLNYALGIAQGEIYKLQLDELQKIEQEELKKARLEEIERIYKRPALDNLKMAKGIDSEDPELIEGLIALYSADYDTAIGKAKNAFEKTGWRYEAHKLMGDAYFAKGLLFGPSSALFDKEKMGEAFGLARDAYEQASTIARSDPDVYNAECELKIQLLMSAAIDADPSESPFEAAMRSCDKAAQASSRNQRGMGRRSFVVAVKAWVQLASGENPGELDRVIAESKRLAYSYRNQFPDDFFGDYLVGSALRTSGFYKVDLGLDSREELSESIDAYRSAIRHNSSFSWAPNELCSALDLRLYQNRRLGVDIESEAAEISKTCNAALKLDPDSSLTQLVKVSTRITEAYYLNEFGKPAGLSIGAAQAELAALKSKSLNLPAIPNFEARALHVNALELLAKGDDPTIALDEALGHAERVRTMASNTSEPYELTGLLELARARYKFSRDIDPLPALEKAAASFAEALKKKPYVIEFSIQLARTKALKIAWIMKKGPADDRLFEDAEEILRPLLDSRFEPRIFLSAAELCALKAEQSSRHLKKDPGEQIQTCLNYIETALKNYPTMAEAFWLRAKLLEMRALGQKDKGKAREDRALSAKAAEEAVRLNPWLSREVSQEIPELKSPR